MLIVANWKAYVDTLAQAKKLLASAKRAARTKGMQIVLAPSSALLGLLSVGNRTKVQFAAQDLSAVTVGAATGEVPATLLYSLGVRYSILGHSERRAQGESDASISEKVRRALTVGITPILCIGERDRDEDARYLAILKAQLGSVLQALSPKEREKIIIAYEPVWAIGKSADDALNASDLAEMSLYIRKLLSEYLPENTARKIKILYGGSVEPSNIRTLAKEGRVDGFLIGHASADPTSFAALQKALAP